MDVMMKMTTDDVRKLREKFETPLTLEQFVSVMKTRLADRIQNELEFVVSLIELFHTIDVNGDKTLEWDEFAGYMLDAGQAKGDVTGTIAVDDHKRYKEWDQLSFRDLKTPMNRIKTYIEQLLYLPNLHACAYFEYGGDVVYLYSMHFDQSEAPRHVATIRLHTAFQEHKVISMAYVPTKRWLIISSIRTVAYLSVWQLPDYTIFKSSDESANHTFSPTLIHRVEMEFPQEHLVWLPTHHTLVSASVVYPPISNRSDGYQLQRNIRPCSASSTTPGTTLHRTKIYELRNWDIMTLHSSSDHRERIKGVSTLVGFTTASNRPFLIVGREDGILSVFEASNHHEVQTLDAHPHGVKAIAYSMECDALASIGMHSYSDETTHYIVIWNITRTGLLTVETTLKDNQHALQLVSFVDSKRQLITCDLHGVFHVYRHSPEASWSCIQVFSTGMERTVHALLVVPESSLSDAVMITAKHSLISFYDCCISREREEIIYAYYCQPLNLILGATTTMLLFWDAVTGEFVRSFDYRTILRNESTSREDEHEPIITAICVDDRERKVLIGDDHGQIRVLNAMNGNIMKALDPHTCAVHWLSYVLYSKRVISMGMDSVFHVYDENNPIGYYVPYGGGPPQSVLLQSLRILPDTDTSKFEVVKAIGNEQLGLLALLLSGTSHNESFIQIWNLDLSHPQGTCLAPSREEITCLSFFGSSVGILGGTVYGRVFLWTPIPGEMVYSVFMEMQMPQSIIPREPQDSTASPAILHILTMPLERPPSAHPSTTFLTEDGLKSYHMEDRIHRDYDTMHVCTGDEQGWITTWHYKHRKKQATLLTFAIASAAQSKNIMGVNAALGTDEESAPAPADGYFQHEEMIMGYEAVAVLYGNAVKALKRLRCEELKHLMIEPLARWHAHETSAVVSLRMSLDPPTLISSSSIGEIKIWTVEGQLMGVLDHFATRRTPSTIPWHFPVDMRQRRHEQETQARAFLQALRSSTPSRSRQIQRRQSMLEERLSLTPEEMKQSPSRAITPVESRDPNARRRSSILASSWQVTEKMERNERIEKAQQYVQRGMLLAQASTRRVSATQSRIDPDASLHTLLNEVPSETPAHTKPIKKKYSMITLSDMKHVLHRRSKSVILCGPPSVAARPKTPPAIATSSTTRLEFSDLRQERSKRPDPPPIQKKSNPKRDSLVQFHVKLGHTWT